MTLTISELNTWCTELENHPEQQYGGGLVNCGGTRFCCLGKLAVLHGAEIIPSVNAEAREHEMMLKMGDQPMAGLLGSDWKITKRLAVIPRYPSLLVNGGNFEFLGMPDLNYKGMRYNSLVNANDSNVPWPVIAKHLRDCYPAIPDPIGDVK